MYFEKVLSKAADVTGSVKNNSKAVYRFGKLLKILHCIFDNTENLNMVVCLSIIRYIAARTG